MRKYTLSNKQYLTALRESEVVITIKGKKDLRTSKTRMLLSTRLPYEPYLDIEIYDNSQSDNYDDSNKWGLGQL